MKHLLMVLGVCLPAFVVAQGTAGRVELLRSTGGLPAHIAGMFSRPAGFQRAATGEYWVFDRGDHSVYRVDAAATAAQRIVQIGSEAGRILGPTAFDLGPNRTLVVADSPRRQERVQVFSFTGRRLGGFMLPGKANPRLMIDGMVLNGAGSLEYTGRSVLMNQPETGALITEYALSGRAVRSFGTFRPTGHESDREVHLALNSGLSLVNPKGGFYFVFQAGVPIFRKYDQSGSVALRAPHRRSRTRRGHPLTCPRSGHAVRIAGGSELPSDPAHRFALPRSIRTATCGSR